MSPLVRLAQKLHMFGQRAVIWYIAGVVTAILAFAIADAIWEAR